MREVRQDDKLVANPAAEFAHFLMRFLKEVIENTEFVHQFERGRMDRIAAKVTQEVRMFFEHHNVNPAARQQKTQHHACGTAASMQRAYATLKGNMTEAAAKMPEANYTFKPASDPNLRTFGQWIGHQADNQFLNCATIKGVPNPSPAQSNEKKATKAELVKALADAFAFCDGAISSLTDQNALQMVKQGEGETARGGVASALLSHGLESYGIVVVYLRAKGIAPPNANPGGRGGRGGRGGQ